MLSFQKYFLCGLILSMGTTLFNYNPTSHLKNQNLVNDRIPWTSKTVLKWSDFKARANKSSPYSAESSLQISYGMKIQTVGSNTTVEFVVDCFFEKGESWVKSDKKSDKLLGHEQVHFDIAEYFARELRREFKENTFDTKNYQTKSTALFDKVFTRYQKFQAEYDEDTKHGIDSEAQAKWKEKVSELINKSKAYERRQ